MDSAVRADITINALDPRGLVAPYGVPQSRGVDQSAFVYKSLSDTQEAVVLDELADATGGVFFHNNNDVDEGFRRVSAAPEYSYVLAFSPQDVKLDGHLHKLKVALKNRGNMTVQARRGYFARKLGTDNSK